METNQPKAYEQTTGFERLLFKESEQMDWEEIGLL